MPGKNVEYVLEIQEIMENHGKKHETIMRRMEK